MTLAETARARIAEIDGRLLDLLRLRLELSRTLLRPPGSGARDERVEAGHMVARYTEALGPPAELVARSVWNLCRASTDVDVPPNS